MVILIHIRFTTATSIIILASPTASYLIQSIILALLLQLPYLFTI